MKKSSLSFYFIFISFFTFIAIFFTIVQKSYDNLINPIKKVEESTLTKPINPQLDMDVIDQIQNRTEYLDENVNLFTSPDTSPTPVASESSSINN
jgi:hypothetical protein